MAFAVGFGNASVMSALGQPLQVEIALSDTGNVDKSDLTARLASPDAFAAAGVDYPYNLTKLKFAIESHNGQSYVKVTSKDAINDPFITLLVELSWPSGRLLREYTFLIDPPGYKAEQLKPEAVAPIEPTIAAAPVAQAAPVPAVTEKVTAPAEEAAAPAATASSTELVAATPVSAPAAVSTTKEKASPAPAEAPAAMEELAAASAPAATEAVPVPVAAAGQVEAKKPEVEKTITVRRGDTLTKIAQRIQRPDVTLEQMLVALYRTNASKFDGKNMNRIRAGKILRAPSQAVLEKLSTTEAVKEIRIQTADWNAYKQKLAAASVPAAPKQAPKQETSGKISTAVTDKTPAVKKSATEVLKLSKGAAPGDKTAAGGKAMTPQEKANAKQEEAIAKGKAKKETGQREAMLEKNVTEMQKLVELKSQAAAAKPAPQPATPTAAPPAKAAAPAGHPPLKPLPKKPRVILPPPARAPTSMVDSVLDTINGIVSGVVSTVTGNPLYLAALGGIVLLGGLGFVVIRRRGGGGKKKKVTQKQLKKKLKDHKPLEDLAFTDEETASEVESTIVDRQPLVEVEEPLESTVAHVAAASAPAMGTEETEVDPISEAELFLNFGRDAQAEEILKDALSKNPSNRAAQLKLLSIYVSRKDANSFSSIASQIKDSGDATAWEQVAAMGREIDPSNPTYGGTGAAAPEALAESGRQEAAPPPLDMDIGFDVPMDLDVTAATPAVPADTGETMDFDISGQTSSAPTDFDVTAATPSVSADDMGVSFDITGSQPKATEGMDFNITGSQVKPTENMDFNITGSQINATEHMDFDVTGSHPNVTEHTDFDVTGGHPEVSEELHMDFDVTSSHPAVTEAAGAHEDQTTMMLSGGSMDFDVTGESTLPGGPGQDESSVLESDILQFDVSSGAYAPARNIDLGGINLDLGQEVTTLVSPVAEAKQDEKWHEVATKLDLAKAYQEMGDADGAREILGEVIRDGDDEQQEAAQALMQQL